MKCKTDVQWAICVFWVLFLMGLVGFTIPVPAQTFTLVKPVSATATVNNADAPNTIDDNPNEFTALVTYWQAAQDPEACITFDLGEIKQVVGIRETSGPFPGNPFTLFVSTDGVNFTQVVSGTLTQSAFGQHLFTVTNARFIKMCVQRTDATGFGELADFRALVPAEMSVAIDIKPGSDPNCFNNNGNGVIPVAILGSANFDVTKVDAGTVALEGLPVKVVGKSNKLLASIKDSNNDGFNDLVVQIEDIDGVFSPGDTTATLTGNLKVEFGGTPIKGTDTICIVPTSGAPALNPRSKLTTTWAKIKQGR